MRIKENKDSVFIKGKKPTDLAIVFANVEGIQHQEGGVARYTRNFIKFLASVEKFFEQKNIKITIYAAEPALLQCIPSYNIDEYNDILDIIRNTGGDFYKLINNTAGNDWISKTDNWKILSASAATLILNIAEKHEACMAILGCSCLAAAPVYLHKQLRCFDADVRTVYMINDSAFSSFYNEVDENILAVDYVCTYWSKLYQNAKIGYVSKFSKELFTDKFGLQEENFVPTKSGIVVKDSKYTKLSYEKKKAILLRNRIPVEKKIIMSWGRSVGYKRLDLVFGVCKLLADEYYPVVVTNGEFPELRAYQKSLGIEGRLIERYKDFDLISALLQWDNTFGCLFLSEEEPGSIAPMEAMLLSEENGPIVITNSTGIYNELIQDNVNGFIVENSMENIAKKIREISLYSEEKLNQIRKNAYCTVLKEFSQERKYIETLICNIPYFKRYENELLQYITNE